MGRVSGWPWNDDALWILVAVASPWVVVALYFLVRRVRDKIRWRRDPKSVFGNYRDQ